MYLILKFWFGSEGIVIHLDVSRTDDLLVFRNGQKRIRIKGGGGRVRPIMEWKANHRAEVFYLVWCCLIPKAPLGETHGVQENDTSSDRFAPVGGVKSNGWCNGVESTVHDHHGIRISPESSVYSEACSLSTWWRASRGLHIIKEIW